MSDILLRPMQVEDAAQISQLFQTSFPKDIQQYMIYGQAGLAAYLSDLCEHPSLFPQFHFTVAAATSRQILGFTEFRLKGEYGFLSNIFISETARGQGLGSRMIQHFIQSYPDVKVIELDVFESNAGAKSLYRHLGFNDQKVTYWKTQRLDGLELPSHTRPAEVQISVPSMAMHARYGFSELSVKTAAHEFRFGRIGDHVLRVFPSTLEAASQELMNAILAVKANFQQLNTLFMITPESNSPGDLVDKSWRMQYVMKKASPFIGDAL